MAMKKKFLGLALAGAMTLSASSVYASNQTIDFNETGSYNHNVQVSGSVLKGDGTAAEGKIQVELPTTMSFSVDQKGNFQGCDFEVKNNSNVDIDVSVTEFRSGSGNINLEETGFDVANNDRSHVSLSLNGRFGGVETNVDLKGISESGQETDVLNVSPNSTGLIKLKGEAGTKEVEIPDGNDVDSKGASGDFSLIFKIKKGK